MLTADLERCPYCGSNRIDGGDYDAINANMNWQDGHDAHALADGQIAGTRAHSARHVCRDCGGVWTEGNQ